MAARGRNPDGERAGQRELGLFERFPVRRVVLVVLSVGIVLGVVLGTWRTLTIPESQGRFSSSTWRDLVTLGLAQGTIYALIALGYSLVYGILRMINFAHGEVFMSGAYASFFVASTLDSSGFLNRNPVLSIAILLAVSVAVSMLVALLLERVAYRPIRGSPRLVPLITAIGASLFLQNTFRGFFGPSSRGYPSFKVLAGTWTLFGVRFLRPHVLVFVAAMITVIGLALFVSRTRTGKSMRAVAEDQEVAALMGINANRVIVVTFAIGGLMAGIAGVMGGLVFGQVRFDMGFVPGIKAFTAAVLGG